MVFALIFLWLHFLKSCRPFTTFGIFITMLGYALKETLVYCGIFAIFVTPFVASFWLLFGGHIASKENPIRLDEEGDDLSDVLFFSWLVTTNGKFEKDTIMENDRLMAQVRFFFIF